LNREAFASGLVDMAEGMETISLVLSRLCASGVGELCREAAEPPVVAPALSLAERSHNRGPHDEQREQHPGRNPYRDENAGNGGGCNMAEYELTPDVVGTLALGWNRMSEGMKMLRHADLTWTEAPAQAREEAEQGLVLFNEGAAYVTDALEAVPATPVE
jgi:hypothetical protein